MQSSAPESFLKAHGNFGCLYDLVELGICVLGANITDLEGGEMEVGGFGFELSGR